MYPYGISSSAINHIGMKDLLLLVRQIHAFALVKFENILLQKFIEFVKKKTPSDRKYEDKCKTILFFLMAMMCTVNEHKLKLFV